MRSNRQIRRNAFTLIELLLVMVILVVLASVVVPKFASRGEQARQAAAKSDISTLETAMDAFEIDNGRYPTNEEQLQALVQPPSGLTNWHGPYIGKGQVPVDPWGRPYVYAYPGTHNQMGYDLYSLGPNGREDELAVGNWGTAAQ